MRRLNDGAPTAAGRRGGVERPRASLADPPSISGPAASAWRPMTAACRAHDRAAPPPPRALCRCWPPAMPAPAARRGGIERPRASLVDPPSISGPATSAWRPMTGTCRAHDRAALAARRPWPPPRGAAHHKPPPPQRRATHATRHRHTPHHLLPLKDVSINTPLNATYP